MAKLAGLKGCVTVKIGEAVIVHEFTLPLDVTAAYDEASSSATLKVHAEPFNAAVNRLADWVRGFPDLASAPPAPSPSACVCMQPWNSITGRTCPVHGYSAPLQVTC